METLGATAIEVVIARAVLGPGERGQEKWMRQHTRCSYPVPADIRPSITVSGPGNAELSRFLYSN